MFNVRYVDQTNLKKIFFVGQFCDAVIVNVRYVEPTDLRLMMCVTQIQTDLFSSLIKTFTVGI